MTQILKETVLRFGFKKALDKVQNEVLTPKEFIKFKQMIDEILAVETMQCWRYINGKSAITDETKIKSIERLFKTKGIKEVWDNIKVKQVIETTIK